MGTISSRFWRFALVNLAGLIVVAIAIAALYRYVAVENFKELRTEQNVELAIALSNTIVDDILDIVGDEETLGKTAGIDVEQGRGFTAVESTNGSNGNGTHAEDVMESIKRKLMAGDRLQEARDQAETLAQLAIGYLDVLPDSDAKEELIDLADKVVSRDR